MGQIIPSYPRGFTSGRAEAKTVVLGGSWPALILGCLPGANGSING
jgi:hypothetical protein